jgi:hypothetical protein
MIRKICITCYKVLNIRFAPMWPYFLLFEDTPTFTFTWSLMSKECFLPIEIMCVYQHTFVYLHLKHISIILNVNVLKRAVDLYSDKIILFWSCFILVQLKCLIVWSSKTVLITFLKNDQFFEYDGLLVYEGRGLFLPFKRILLWDNNLFSIIIRINLKKKII